MKKKLIAILSLGLFLGLSTGSSLAANPTVYGKTYGEWSAEWWKWIYSIPKDMNPLTDETGEYCDVGQSGPVWFLAGSRGTTGVERECTIPAGKAIFYPIVNVVWVDEPGDEVLSDEEVRWILANFTASGNLACEMASTLDTFNGPTFGEQPAAVSALQQLAVRTQSPKFDFVFPEDNISDLDIPPGPNDRLISEGYWVMLPPLSVGEHRLYLHGAGCGPETDEEGNPTGSGLIERLFEVEVTYNLTVEGGVGENVNIGKNCTPGANFVAGDNVMIGKDCDIGDDVTIGSDTSIGKNVTIVDGVTVGSNVNIGKNATIVADVPDNKIIPKNATYP